MNPKLKDILLVEGDSRDVEQMLAGRAEQNLVNKAVVAHSGEVVMVTSGDVSDFMKAVKQLGVLWGGGQRTAAAYRGEETSIESGEVIFPGKKEVKYEIPALHPAFGG